MTYNAIIKALREKDVDLVIAEAPVEEPGITVGPVLFCERRALVVPATHPLAARETVSLEDLALLPLITPVGMSPLRYEVHFPRRTPIEHGPAAGDWEGLLSLVGAGRGATVTTATSGQYYARPDVAYVPFDDAPPVEYALMWRIAGRQPGLQALIRTVLDLAPRNADRP